MSRKLQMINAIAEGEKVPSFAVEKELEDMDKAEVQAEILKPAIAIVTLEDGRELELPYEFSYNVLFERRKNKIVKTLSYFQTLLASELMNVRGGKQIAATDPLAYGILMSPTVQTAIALVLSVVTGETVVDDDLSGTSTVQFAQWLMAVMDKLNGDSNIKKA